MSFDALGLSESILKAVTAKGYDTPSPIQEQAIPAVLSGQDVMAAAQTGTGKTAGFTLPLLERLSEGTRPGANQIRALVLTPTRELAAQVGESVLTYGKHLPVSSAVVFGGVKINPQMMKLRKGVDVLVATPGRLLDLHTKNAVTFDKVEILVLDEADRMLDMGFIHDIEKIIAMMPKRRQNLLFSATFSPDIRQLAKRLVNQPIEISVSPQNSTAVTIDQWVVPVDKSKKTALLIELIKTRSWFQVLVFSRTKHGANKIAYQLSKAGISSAAIHGNKSQGARTRALAEFKKSEIQVLVATDIAARGLDIDQLPQVVNYDLPHVAEDYVHRIGRTGRAGAEGQAVSLVCAAEAKELFGIERLIRELIPRRGVPGFTPKEKLPDSPKNLKPIKPKKPKKNKAKKALSTREQAPADKHNGNKTDAAKKHGRDKLIESKGSTNRNKGKDSANKTVKDNVKKTRNKKPHKGERHLTSGTSGASRKPGSEGGAKKRSPRKRRP